MLDFWTREDRGASWDRWTRRWALRWGQRRRQVLRLSCPRDLCAIVLGHHGEPQLCLYWRAGIGVAELQAGVHRTASYEVGLLSQAEPVQQGFEVQYMSVEEQTRPTNEPCRNNRGVAVAELQFGGMMDF